MSSLQALTETDICNPPEDWEQTPLFISLLPRSRNRNLWRDSTVEATKWHEFFMQQLYCGVSSYVLPRFLLKSLTVGLPARANSYHFHNVRGDNKTAVNLISSAAMLSQSHAKKKTVAVYIPPLLITHLLCDLLEGKMIKSLAVVWNSKNVFHIIQVTDSYIRPASKTSRQCCRKPE